MNLILIILNSFFNYNVATAEMGSSAQYQQMKPRHDHRAQVEAIAKEQGIDMSTEEGRHRLAQYLHQTGQQNLLPPRPPRRGGIHNSSNQGGERSGGQQGNKPIAPPTY